MTNLKKFQQQAARPLPVIVLADTSGSMDGDKINTLNNALSKMIKSFQKESRLRAEIHLSVITFGGSEAKESLELTPAQKIEDFKPLIASGPTPMGGAFALTSALIEDKEKIPSRAYQPVIILVSDGHPNDRYEEAFNQLMNGERSSKATRFAMAIGADADTNMLRDFANDPEAPVFEAENASDIYRFFKAVTMSVTTKSQSKTPNQTVPLTLPPAEKEDDEFEDVGF
ncbi:Phage/colicin/tellurite resistance cluster TerY protein [Oleispira antarctica RB-8]|uniref:Phage/colicin/tellurite resistance cluster TerY protein n=1 Tax=Oleispira antarctica RB-8 TaxID=698738 RepID=R4YP60_OLEAN|nr:Phage/colicin/tellurite resistance cluster TerY protein [Oleispira antarctica RB-8]